MLRQVDCDRFSYDRAADVATLAHGDARVGAGAPRTSVSLLLDAKGFLVGVDIDDSARGRFVLMAGPHESVDRTVPATCIVAHGPEGEPVAVAITNAKAQVRGDERNPYVR